MLHSPCDNIRLAYSLCIIKMEDLNNSEFCSESDHYTAPLCIHIPTHTCALFLCVPEGQSKHKTHSHTKKTHTHAQIHRLCSSFSAQQPEETVINDVRMACA